ncbi:ER lumen protein retaining receptor [Enteropsectra breve]|nr:ER lumen protein retaining receptor [Enteropsectra breve]
MPKIVSLRFAADLSMCLGRAFLLKKVIETKSVSGLSLKTQFLYLITYLFRYLDLFNLSKSAGSYTMMYNSVMKFIFIAYQIVIIFYIASKYKHTYNKRHDNFNILAVIGIAAALSPFIKVSTSTVYDYVEEYLYTFSLLIETVAILPQLSMLQEAGDCESLTAIYIGLMGVYRFLYVIYFYTGFGFKHQSVQIISGVIQTFLYGDFFVVYCKQALKKGKRLFSTSF